jgi:hypothetical protein
MNRLIDAETIELGPISIPSQAAKAAVMLAVENSRARFGTLIWSV